MSIRNLKTIVERQEFIKNKLNINLETIKIYPKGLDPAQFANCENMIGAVQVPLGVAGPLLVNGRYAKGEYYIPLATTEAALVASVNRGCKSITRSGGAVVVSEKVGVTRGPVYKTEGVAQGLKFKDWLDDNFIYLKKEAAKTSSHLALTKINTEIVGKYVYVRFYFDTSEAMGMNMVTIATDAINKFIESKTGIKCLSVAGNFDVDKKPAWLNFISGRGKKVWAESTITRDTLKSVLKVSAQDIYNVWLGKCMMGSIMSGTIGANAHFANILAALFLATGQDMAHVVEGSMGITTTEVCGEDLYISVYIPDLMIGTVGGGTKLPSQKEALSIMDIGVDENSSLKLAEICASAVLAGEISLLASLAEGSLATTHARLAR